MQKKKLWVRLVVLGLFISLAGASAYAQAASGEILGRVTDQQGAVVAGATVTAKETTTGRTRTTTTNTEGNYSFPLLQPGTYEVTAEAPNMGKGVATVQVLLQQRRDANFSLKPAAEGTVVEVTGEAPLIETTNSEVKTNIDPKQMNQLPLRDRNFASLATLSPNIRPVGSFDPTKLRTGNVSINGATGRSMNLSVDGGDNKDNVVGGFLQNFTTEGIQEFVIETHRFGADTGKSAGGVVTIATKGGTNDFHGSAFFFMRNKNLNAKDFFTENPNFVGCGPDDPETCYEGPAGEKPPFQRNNWGGSIGGPIVRDRAYFFGALERTHENASLTQAGITIPALAAFQALQPTITDPILSTAPIDPSPTVPIPFRDWQWQARGDFVLNPAHNLFVRYAQQNNEVSNDQIAGTEDPNQGATQSNDLNSLLANWTWTMGPRTLNQFVFQWSDFLNSIQAQPGSAGVPLVVFDSNGVSLGQNGNVPQTTEQTKWQFRNDFSLRVGNHSIKLGFQEVATTKFGGQFAFSQTPNIFLRCSPEELGTVDCPFASLEDPGIVRRVVMAGGEPFFFQDTIHQISYYFQDDWKVHPRLTLNLGIRNDIDYGLVPTDDQENNRTIVGMRAAGLTTMPGTGTPLCCPDTDINNWAPRLGFAWDVTGNGNFVLRGGYGVFFDQLFQNVTLFAVQQANPNVYSTVFDVRYPASGASAIGLSQGVAAVGTFPVTTAPDLPYGARGRIVAPDFQNPYSQHFTLGAQWQFANNWVFSTDVIHVLSLHEFAQREVNPATDGSNDSRILNAAFDPVFGCANVFGTPVACGTTDPVTGAAALHRFNRITLAESNSRSRFDSATFELKRRFANRYQFGASYILSRGVTYGGFASDFGLISAGTCPGCTDITSSVLAGIVQPQNFGYSSEDERHRFVFNGIAELPWGFMVSGITQMSSARPNIMYADDDLNGDGAFVDYYSNTVTNDPIFDPLGIGDVRFSTRPNSLRGDPYYQTDIRVQKTFNFGERVRLEAIGDLFNIFNTVNFGGGISFIEGDSAFDGVPLNVCPCPGGYVGPEVTELPRVPVGLFGGGFGGAGTVGIPFQMQLGLRLRF